MLKLQFKDKRNDPFWVIEKLYNIGSDAGNHLVLADPGVDRLHARLVNTGEKCYLRDNNSQTGCFVNGQRITQKELLTGDVIRLGPVELEVVDPRASINPDKVSGEEQWRLVADGSWLAGQSFPIPTNHPATIGRGNQCDIVIPGTHLSRRHAELTVLGSTLRVKDLGSSNGTFINEQPVTETLAHSGDHLRIDVYRFRIIGPDADPGRTHLRRPSPSQDSMPAAARKAPEAGVPPKRWKTRPTSPGNRHEPTYRQETGSHWLWVVLIIIAIVLVASFYLL